VNGDSDPAIQPTETADLVVVGYGAAGAATAITAHDAGASVVIVEKNPEDAHTPNLRMSGGMVMTVTDSDRAARYLDGCASGRVPLSVTQAWANRAADLGRWMEEAVGGLDMVATAGAEHPGFEGADAIVTVQPGGITERLAVAAGAGPRLFAGVSGAIRRRGLDIRWSSPAERLITRDGRVTGVQIRTDEGLRAIGARRGVVLCSGGYEYDEGLKSDSLPISPVHFYGNPGNTGDGIRMAQAVGASLWHMNQMVGRAIGHFELPGGTPLNLLISIGPPGYVITDRAGCRFANEHGQAMLRHDFYHDLLLYDPARNHHPRVPCYWFFDESRRRAGPITLTHIGAVAVGMYDWSSDNRVEIDRGWISQGATIEEAAIAAGLDDPAAAACTVLDYNEQCRNGNSDALGRPPETMVPLAEPPFYCVPLWPGGSNTTGGPRRDQHSRVLDPFDKPIPGLYAAGELGQASGLLYPADGSNLSEAFCFGQIAAEHALGTGT
jgi:succinate dehydrogenase/fumarate reductase flavoprotein subunit